MIEVTRVARHMSSDEVKMKMQMTAGFHKMQKWLVIYNALIDPRPVSEIAKHTGLSEFSVQKILSEYNQSGPGSLESYEAVVAHRWSERKRM
ncbi:MAG: helix-turn-helix domain-containing protein [Desulforhabdus sp.]|jgi:hypothetical protein|nr:helix-turn-helix domain-containing protein [Desulforhabdus sp.]